MNVTPRLPGQDLVHQGLKDLSQGVASVPALLVSIGAPRLRRLGLTVDHAFDQPERRLYDVLRDVDPDTAHSKYNSYIRRLVSFERAMECVS